MRMISIFVVALRWGVLSNWNEVLLVGFGTLGCSSNAITKNPSRRLQLTGDDRWMLISQREEVLIEEF